MVCPGCKHDVMRVFCRYLKTSLVHCEGVRGYLQFMQINKTLVLSLFFITLCGINQLSRVDFSAFYVI